MRLTFYKHYPLMEEAGENGGAAGAAPAPAAAEDAAPTKATDAPADPGDLSAVTLGANPATPAPTAQGDAAQPAEGTQPAQKDGLQTDAPAEVKVEDYAAGAKIDDALAGDVDVDRGAIAAVAPLLKEAGVSVEMANRLVNALAKYQVESFKSRQAERFADNKRMHDAAVARYSRADFEEINAGIDAAFKPDGVMNYVVRNSEIGNDPEFLALMKWYGSHKPTNLQPSAAAGTGGTTGQPAGFEGIAGAWA